MATLPSCTVQPPKRLLFGPGPSPVHPRVYAALAQPIVGHLDPYFFEINEQIRHALQHCWGTSNEFTMVLSGTGSAGMEAAVANFVEPGAKFAIFVNGYFGERLSEMGRRHGANLIRFEKPWGEVFTDQESAALIHRDKPDVVAFVNAETSTGAHQDGAAIAKAAREVGALSIADCVTSLGGMPIGLDAMGVDVAYSGTQKALGCPPGLAPITCSPRAVEWLRARKSTPVTWYLDLKLLLDYYEKAHRYHHTAPISMFYALRESLAIIEEEGLENRFARHRTNHEAFAAGVEKTGHALVGSARDPALDFEHAARARGHRRGEDPPEPDAQSRHRDCRWTWAVGRQSIPHWNHGLRFNGGQREVAAGNTRRGAARTRLRPLSWAFGRDERGRGSRLSSAKK